MKRRDIMKIAHDIDTCRVIDLIFVNANGI